MAIIKNFDAEGKYMDEDALYNVSNYIERNAEKTIYRGTSEGYVPADMSALQKKYDDADGKQLIHFVLSFSKKDNPSKGRVESISDAVCTTIFDEGYQVMSGIHTNAGNRHIHFMVNPVNIKNGERLCPDKYVKKESKNKLKKKLNLYGVKVTRIYHQE